MTDPAWEAVKDIVAEAMDLEPRARSAFLDKECLGKPDLRREVESLLQFDAPGSAFSNIDRVPERLGPYRVVREIGRGGMGTVYLGERDDGQFEQRVAIKVIKRGMDTDAVLRRFYAERQILARLQHPNITRLLDGGTFDGRPYFVMEYLEGEPLLDYCRGAALGIDRRIVLFLAVCEAVDHAHRNLVLHRDIKTGNILVDSSGTPKLMDFGIAKLLGEGDAAEQTATAFRPMTPQNASPEQLRGEPLTTASDVYALGVLLFELLAGCPPYRVSANSPSELARIVCEEPAPKPSSLAQPDTAKFLRGDLDNIVLKALEKDADRRYRWCAELAADLGRYREGLPVLAKAGTAVYRCRKFILRNRRAFAVAAVLLFAILAGSVGTAWYAYRARLAEANAERRFDALHRLTNSMLFEVDDAIAGLQGATAARAAIVNRTLEYLDQMASDSGNNTAVLRDLASAYLRVGRIQGAQRTAHLGGAGALQNSRQSFEKALIIQRRLAAVAPDNLQLKADLIETESQIAAMYEAGGDLDRALALDAELVSNTRALADRSSGNRQLYVDLKYRQSGILTGMGYIGMSLGDLSRALDYVREGMSIRIGLLAGHPGDKRAMRAVGISHNYMSLCLEAANRYSEAVDEERLALTNWEPLADADPNNADIHSLLGDGNERLCQNLSRMGSFGEALQHCQTSLRIDQAAAKADPNDVQSAADLATALSAMSDLLDRMGKTRDAIGWETRARNSYRTIEAKDPDSIQTGSDDASSLVHFAILESKLGSREAARKDLRLAQAMLEPQMQRSPKNLQLRGVYDRATSAMRDIR